MDIESFLESEEKVLWAGSQNYKSLLVDSLFLFVMFAGLGGMLYFLGSSGAECEINGVVSTGETCGRWAKIFAFIFASGGLWALKPFLKKNSGIDHYAITDRRIILLDKASAFKGRSIRHEDIKDLKFKWGLVTKTAQIQIDTGKTQKGFKGTPVQDFDIMFGIENPKKVFDILQKAKNSTMESFYINPTIYFTRRLCWGGRM